MQGEKIEAWFASLSTSEYFGVESKAFRSANKFTKNLSTGMMNFYIYVFSISEATKIAVSFSKSQCLYAMFLL